MLTYLHIYIFTYLHEYYTVRKIIINKRTDDQITNETKEINEIGTEQSKRHQPNKLKSSR